jgi:catechol 2,3-dioxygenase-like lactoylglutathione lyase family enzyme
MAQTIGYIALVVRDYDEAIAFYTERLGFKLIEDKPVENKRWVLVSPRGQDAPCLLLARAATAEQKSRIGNQTGGRVFLFLHTDDFHRDYRDFIARGVRFVRPPREEDYGTVAVFEDLYGNKWDLVQLRPGCETSSPPAPSAKP